MNWVWIKLWMSLISKFWLIKNAISSTKAKQMIKNLSSSTSHKKTLSFRLSLREKKILAHSFMNQFWWEKNMNANIMNTQIFHLIIFTLTYVLMDNFLSMFFSWRLSNFIRLTSINRKKKLYLHLVQTLLFLNSWYKRKSNILNIKSKINYQYQLRYYYNFLILTFYTCEKIECYQYIFL